MKRDLKGRFMSKAKSIGDLVEVSVITTWDYMKKTIIIVYVVGMVYGVSNYKSILPEFNKTAPQATAEEVIKGDNRDFTYSAFNKTKESIANSTAWKASTKAKHDALDKELEGDLNIQAVNVLSMSTEQIYHEVKQ